MGNGSTDDGVSNGVASARRRYSTLSIGGHGCNEASFELKAAMFRNGMRPVHPGEILREDYLVPLDMSATALAKD